MKPKTILCVFFIGVLIILALNVRSYPVVTEHVTDLAHVLTQDEIKSLTDTCQGIEDRTTVEIAIVTTPSTNGEGRVIYANRIGDASGVGKKETDNGVVILWSMDNEKGGAIATGRGIESTLNDAKVGRMGRASRSYFDNGQYYQGFKTILDEIDKEIEPNTSASVTTPPQQLELTPVQKVIILFLVCLLLLIVVGAIIGGSGGSGRGISYIGGSSWSGGSSGGSFGGGSFGGGGSSW